MPLTDKLTAIADAIRAKSGKTDAMTLDEMPTEIGALSAEEIIKHTEIPTYVKAAALEVARKVRSVQTDDSIVFLAMSDSHYYGEQGSAGVDSYVDANGTQGNISNLHAAQAAKILAYALDFDFMAHLGDATWGYKTTHSALLNAQIKDLFAMLRESHADLPCFHAIGNHDAGIYYHDYMIEQGNAGIYTESGDNLYNTFTALSASEDTVFGGEAYGGYCYRDFADKKLRVFLLNTSEAIVYEQQDNCTLGSQRLWLANALLDLNSKSDAAEWKTLILCHYPADYGGTMPLSNLIKAYVTGGSITISIEDGTSSTVSFAGKNSAKFIAQLHGHVHNFLTSKLHDSSGSQYDAWRIGIPNAQYNRENYYGTVAGVDFAEKTTYLKTANTANDTSFVVNVINPSEEKIYSFCYGAGYDRVIGYGAVAYYSISRSLTNATSDNTAVSIEEGKPYSETITLASGCDMQTITVTMGGTDITSTAITSVDGGYQISIAEVTGNIVITAKAQARPNFTNLVPLSIDTDGSDYNVDGDGYDNDTYLSSGSLHSMSGFTTTGFIPVNEGVKTIRIAGEGISVDSEYTRVSFYDSNFAHLATIPLRQVGSSEYYPALVEEDSTVLTIVTKDNGSAISGGEGVYMRICTKGDGANLIVTVDEEITYGGDADATYAVIQNLTNVKSSNTAASVAKGGLFYATLTANSGYELQTVTVTMGGLDVTSSVYASGQITISNVTGNIAITATASAVGASYTNQLPISTDADGNIYNGAGYKADIYLSSGAEGSRTGSYVSGFIPATAGDTLYFKNVTLQNGNNYHRFAAYDADKNFIASSQFSTSNTQTHLVFTFGEDGKIDSIAIAANSSYYKNAAYIRFCCSYLGGDSVVTVNEPIE